ncbi:flagellin B [Thermoplasma volcanium GSS1]|uniref:Flagellin n=1 Tax=Thermoplasma volcanium (strain ATCC 51530 / DSM 4299 / JCM 9571 / NBRC 15438 / GSS1) TaxID=273116 RepID=Q978G2_THEVO|nr:flagellin [Thermoplasma volcanium]BAB60595.1 flagellin B [Thermoplasma volcanium GSS1]
MYIVKKMPILKLLNSIKRIFKTDDSKAESGIGVLIVFIAMILVAAVAASVLIHTAGILQQKASSTGTTTIQQVSTGVIINQIIGYDNASPPESGGISYLAIFVSISSGGTPVDLANTTVTLTVGGVTAVLVYNSSVFADIAGSGSANLFSLPVWSELSAKNRNPTSFGVIVNFDPSHSLTRHYPVLSVGDSAAIIINVTNTFGSNITQDSVVSGQVTPETGTPAIIQFTAPTSFTTKSIEVQ